MSAVGTCARVIQAAIVCGGDSATLKLHVPNVWDFGPPENGASFRLKLVMATFLVLWDTERQPPGPPKQT